MSLPEEHEKQPGEATITEDGTVLLVECKSDEGTVVSVPKGTSVYDALAALTDECECGAPYHKRVRE